MKRCILLSLILLTLLCGSVVVARSIIVYRVIAAGGDTAYVLGGRFCRWNHRTRRWDRIAAPRGAPANWLDGLGAPGFSDVDPDGNFWLVTDTGLMQFSVDRGWRTFEFPEDTRITLHGEITIGEFGIMRYPGDVGIAAGRDVIWVSAPLYLLRFQRENQAWSVYQWPVSQRSGMLELDEQGRVWVHANARYDGKDWFYVETPCPRFSTSMASRKYGLDANGWPWVAGKTGIWRYEPNTEEWELMTVPWGALSKPCAVTTFKGRIYAAQYALGIFCYEDGEWSQLSHWWVKPSLRHATGLLASGDALWANTYYGVARFDGRRWTAHFDRSYSTEPSVFVGILCVLLGVLLWRLARPLVRATRFVWTRLRRRS